MTRHQRQHRELLELCESGAVARAIDLAFQHFADFGRCADVLDHLASAVERTAAPGPIRRRFDDLRAAGRDESAHGQPRVSRPAQSRPTHHEQGDRR